jgi:hypothetical protein
MKNQRKLPSSDKKTVTITKHGIIYHVPVRPLKEMEGFISGLDTENLRDESD